MQHIHDLMIAHGAACGGAEKAVQIGRTDYEDRDLDVVPVSDPGQVSDMQKMARAEALLEAFNGDPLINQLQDAEPIHVGAVGHSTAV